MAKTDQSKSRWQRFLDNDIVYSFFTTPGAIIAATITFIAITAAFAAPLIAPYNPFDPAQISLWDGKLPPAWSDGGSSAYLLGTDNQGRDMLSTILYGGRISILVGIAAVFLGMLLGVTLGVISGYFGGLTDTVIMRIADVQLTIPGILVAITRTGRSVFGKICRRMILNFGNPMSLAACTYSFSASTSVAPRATRAN